MRGTKQSFFLVFEDRDTIFFRVSLLVFVLLGLFYVKNRDCLKGEGREMSLRFSQAYFCLDQLCTLPVGK